MSDALAMAIDCKSFALCQNRVCRTMKNEIRIRATTALRSVLFALLVPVASYAEDVNSGPVAALPEGPLTETVTVTTTTSTTVSTTTSTTAVPTTTLPEIRACPDLRTDPQLTAELGLTKRADMNGNEVFVRPSSSQYCDPPEEGHKTSPIFCFENPYQSGEYTEVMAMRGRGTSLGNKYKGVKGWIKFRNNVLDIGKAYPGACYICGCFRGNQTSGGNGCFPPGVRILMADQSLKKIEEIKAGEKVWNPVQKKAIVVAQVVEGPENLPLIELGFAGRTVIVSQEHPVLTASGSKPAKLLTLKDMVFDTAGKQHLLTVLKRLELEEGQRVINLDLAAATEDPSERLLLSDGIITGDIVLQKRLASEAKATK